MNVDPQRRALDRQWERAQRYIAEGQFAAARAALDALLARSPGNTQARLLISSVCLKQGQLRAACAHLVEAVRALPDDAEQIHTLGFCLHQVGETVALRECLEHPAIARSSSGALLARVAHLHQLLGAHERALALMDRALKLGFDNPDFRYYRSLQLQFNGRMREAEAELEAALRMGPTHGRASLALARMRRQTAGANHLDYIEAQLSRVAPGGEDHAALEFARFKELDDLDRRDEAWAALQHGNGIMRARVNHDPERERVWFETIEHLCTEAFVNARGDAQDERGPQPIFILGMPRSGTTLLERVLGNHSQVATPGELSDFPRQMRWTADVHGTAIVDDDLLERAAALDYALMGQRYLWQSQWRAEGKRFYVDKLPPNFMLAGFIRRALPGARIIHISRDPMDVCFSNWKALFGDSYGYSYGLDTLASHHHGYARLMAHWARVMPAALLDISYNELVEDPDAVAAKIFEFCGLPHEAGCGDILANRRPVSTISSAQVRQTIHNRAIGEWRRYEPHLQPLRAALAAN
ncbi:MAG: sulfotransferase [Rhodanobacteraceae bacterium]